jgi:hypothetical protein
MTDYDALKKLAEAATPGPWTCALELEGSDEVYDADVVSIHIPQIGRSLHDSDWAEKEDRERDLANAEYIAAANPAAILALLAESERLRAALDQLLVLAVRRRDAQWQVDIELTIAAQKEPRR